MASSKVALYIRVSSKEQVEGYSIGEQEERLRNYCKAMLWDIHKVYIDPGYSGGNTDRPGLQSLIKDVKAGEIDKVLVYKLDRLSRSQLDTLYLIEKVFLANNTDFVSMNENFDTSTAFGRAMIGILAVFAQLEREQIKERMGMGKDARAREGKWGGGSSEPVGYDYNPADEQLYINEYEAMQIHELVDLFLKGTPLRTIETLFLEKGYTIKGKSGRISTWDTSRMRYALRNKIYLGYIRHHGEWYKGEHTPIIDQETFDTIQKILDDRLIKYEKQSKKSGQSSLLGGLIFCKHCGGRYCRQAGRKWKGNNPPEYYSCYSRNKSVKKMIKDPNCKNKNWRKDDLENIIFEEIKKLASDPEYMTSIKKEREERTANDPDKITIIRKEVEKIDEQISRFMDLYGIGKFTIEQVSSKVDPLNEQKKNLEKELDQLNAEAGNLSEADAMEIIETFADILDHGDFNEIRMTLEMLISYIDLDNDDIIIHWKFA